MSASQLTHTYEIGLLSVWAKQSYGMADNEDSGRRRLSDLEAWDAAARYETIEAQRVNGWLTDLLPNGKACILDVGAGSGRDAAWLATLGHDVVAIEPDAALREENERRHPDGAYRLLADSLPTLAATCRTGLSFDFILLNAVWMFVAPGQRERAFRKMVTLLKPGGAIALAEDLVIDWWDAAYCSKPTTQERFSLEAKARLPAIESTDDLEDVFAAVAFQRLRLSHDQQIPEWDSSSANPR